MVPVQIIPYVPPLLTCVSTQKHLGYDQLWENCCLIGAFAQLILFFLKCLIKSSACDYQLWPKAACMSILGIWNIFLVILWPRVNAQAHLVYSRFVYMDRWPVVHNHGPENPFLSFNMTVLNLQLHLFFLNIHCGVSPQTSFHFFHVWEWQGSQVKLTPISIQSEGGSGPRPAVLKSFCLPVCQTRLLPWPLENPLVMEHFPSNGIKSL